MRNKQQITATHRLYCKVSGITEKHRFVDPNGDRYDVTAVDNPHNLNQWFQMDLLRTDVEREADA
jgi:hypothetical protein